MEGVQILTYALIIVSICKQIILEVFTLQIARNSQLSQTWLICSSNIRVRVWRKILQMEEVGSWEGLLVSRSSGWVQLHTTLSWSNFGFQERRVKKEEALTLDKEEDSVEVLVKRHRTYPKHQPHVYKPEKASWCCIWLQRLLFCHLRTSQLVFHGLGLRASAVVTDFGHNGIGLFPSLLAGKGGGGVFVLFWFNTLSPFLYIWDDTKSRFSTMVHCVDWTLVVLNIVKSGLLLFRPRVSGA